MAVKRIFRLDVVPAASQTMVSFFLKVQIDIIYLKTGSDLVVKKKGKVMDSNCAWWQNLEDTNYRQTRDRVCPASVHHR